MVIDELPPCLHCGEPVDMGDDVDATAVCDLCLAEARGALERARDVHAQAGAQFVGRERGTRDDVDLRAAALPLARRLRHGR